MSLRRSLLVAGLIGATTSAAFGDDPFLGWTDTYCETVKTLVQSNAGPCRTARSGALMYLAMYDAVNSITKTNAPYLVDYPAPPNASQKAAATCAAYDVMMAIYPTRAYLFDPRLQEDLDAIPDGPEKADGIAVGQAVAAAILASRVDDGSEDTITYEPVMEPGHWRPTWPDYRNANDPHYGRVLPFGMATSGQFLPADAPAIDSEEYFESWDEVRRIGDDRANAIGTLPWEIGWFWANDQDGTFKPTGHMFFLTKVVSQVAGLSLAENARLFGLMGIAIADAAIAAWNTKYETDWDVWRPITGIREADTDGNPLTYPVADWTPASHFTPNFPSYTSGHSTFAAANAQVLRRFLGTDEMEFTLATADPHLPYGATRTMHSFTQAENENADSRVYIGVHWRFDCDRALEVGRLVGDWTFDNYLRPISEQTSGVAERPFAVRLEAVYPNPTPGRTHLRLSTEVPGALRVAVFDASGRRISEVDSRQVAAGSVELVWDGLGSNRRPVAPGVYFVRGTLDGRPLDIHDSRARVVVRH
jgi:hypothetical protein